MSFFIRTHQGLLDALAGKSGVFGTLSSTPDWHLGLSTTVPADDGTNISEPSGNGYARVDVDPADFDASTSALPTILVNNAEFSFPEATGSQGTIVSAVMFDASTGGNALFALSLGASFSVVSGQTVTIPIGDLEVVAT